MGVCVLRVLRGETVFVFLDRRRRANQHAVRVSRLVSMIPVNRNDSPAKPHRASTACVPGGGAGGNLSDGVRPALERHHNNPRLNRKYERIDLLRPVRAANRRRRWEKRCCPKTLLDRVHVWLSPISRELAWEGARLQGCRYVRSIASVLRRSIALRTGRSRRRSRPSFKCAVLCRARVVETFSDSDPGNVKDGRAVGSSQCLLDSGSLRSERMPSRTKRSSSGSS